MNNMYDILAKLDSVDKQKLNEGWKGEIAGGVAGALGGAALAGPIGGTVGAAIGAPLGRKLGGPDEVKEETLNEIAPLIAAGARAMMPLLSRVGSVLAKGAQSGGKAAADVAGKAAAGVGRGTADVAKEVGKAAVQNAPAVGLGVGAYEIAKQFADKMPDAINRVYTDAGEAASAITSVVGNALDSATISSIAMVAVKYGLPLALLLGAMYGGKKLIDKLLSEDAIVKENDMRDLLNKLDYVTEGWKGTAAGAGLGALAGGPIGAAVGALAGDKIGDESEKNNVKEDEVEEGNEFTQARLAAIKAGKPTFKLDGKTYKVTGDTSDEKVMEREFSSRDEFDRRAERGDTVKTAKGTLTKTDHGVRHERRADDEDDSDDEVSDTPKRRGRPKGSKRAIGAKVKGTSKLHSKSAIKEGDLEEDYDKDEYDEEGEMAMSQASTIEDAAKELQSILDADENLPEWVQKKITLAQSYIDSARDYLKANRPEEEMMAEKAVSKAQRAAAGIAYAAKKGDIPKSELRGASKEMAKMDSGELKKFAKTKEKGLPEKKDEAVEETTVSGSVATAPAEAPKGKKGMVFGKGVYESQLAEGFNQKLDSILNEGMNINMSVDETGKKSLTVNATDDDAMKLAQLLKLAGMESAHGESCPSCGQADCGCDSLEEADYANSPDTEEADTDTLVNGLSGGLNGPKLQVNPNNPADNPLAMRDLGKGPSGQINLGKVSEDIKVETETRLMDLYKRIS